MKVNISKYNIFKITMRNVSLSLIRLSILLIVGFSMLLSSCASDQSYKSNRNKTTESKCYYRRTPHNENTHIKNKSSEKKDNKSDDTLQEQLSPM